MVRRVVRRCDICQRNKKTGKSTTLSGGNLQVGRPWQQVGIDLVGPMPVTSRGNKWILVLTDHFTRWQDALPIPNATTVEVAKALDERVFAYFGLPEILHSDRGTQFESEVLSELCDLWRVQKTRTSPYHPQSNGVVERGNRTLGDALRCLLNEHGHEQSHWDELLPHIMRSFRATPNSITKESANFMMMGRECMLPDTIAYGNEVEYPMTVSDYVANLQSRMLEAHEFLRGQQQLSVDQEDELIYKTGDLVLVDNRQRRKGINPKLQPKFVGPYPITKAYDNHTYRLEGYPSVVHETRLKLYSTRVILAQPECTTEETTPKPTSQGKLMDKSPLAGKDGLVTTPTSKASNARTSDGDKKMSSTSGKAKASDDVDKKMSSASSKAKDQRRRVFVNSSLKQKKRTPTATTSQQQGTRKSTREVKQPDRLAY